MKDQQPTSNQDFNAGFIAGVRASDRASDDRPCTIAAWVTVMAILAIGIVIGWAIAAAHFGG